MSGVSAGSLSALSARMTISRSYVQPYISAAARQTRDLLGRVYHGSLSLLVSAMTREEALSKAEIDELYAILDEMEAKQGDA